MTYFRQKFSVSQCWNFSWASLQCFKNFRVSKNFMYNTGITTFCRKNIVSQYRKISRASLQGFRKFGISKNFLHNRGCHVFLSKIFCLTLPKLFVNESYCFWENFLFRKVFTYEKGEYHIFPSKTLVSQSRLKLWASLKCFKQIVEPERFMYNRGYHVFISKFLGRKVPKKFVGVGDPSIFRNFGVIELIYKSKRVSRFLCRIFLSHLAENICKRILLSLRDFLVSKSFYGWKSGVAHFSVKRHWSHRAEKFREHPCIVSEKLWYRKFLCIIGGITFSVKNFRSHSAERIRGHPFNVSESLG